MEAVAMDEKTEFKFSELSEKAKDNVRQRYVEGRDFDDEHTIAESARILAFCGFELDEREYRTVGRWAPAVSYNAGWGAQYVTFEGWWRAEKVDMAGLMEHVGSDDADLKKLGALAMAVFLRYPQAKCKLVSSGMMVHADGAVTDPDMDDRDESLSDTLDSLTRQIDELIQDASTWFCGQLVAEYDWQTDYDRADEYYNESEPDQLFDEDGEEL